MSFWRFGKAVGDVHATILAFTAKASSATSFMWPTLIRHTHPELLPDAHVELRVVRGDVLTSVKMPTTHSISWRQLLLLPEEFLPFLCLFLHHQLRLSCSKFASLLKTSMLQFLLRQRTSIPATLSDILFESTRVRTQCWRVRYLKLSFSMKQI